jgi:plastocyanin
MRLEIHAMRYEDDDGLRATKPTYCTSPAHVDIKPGEEVVIRAKDGVAHVTIDGKEQGWGFSLQKWDFTAVSITYEESEEQ